MTILQLLGRSGWVKTDYAEKLCLQGRNMLGFFSSSSNASPSEGAPLAGYGCTPNSLPKFQHPSHELLKENGFTQQVYHKYRRRCLTGELLRALPKLYRSLQVLSGISFFPIVPHPYFFLGRSSKIYLVPLFYEPCFPFNFTFPDKKITLKFELKLPEDLVWFFTKRQGTLKYSGEKLK